MHTKPTTLETNILNYIDKNQPLTRKEILHEFQAFASNTVYRRIAQLKYAGKITTNNLGMLIISGSDPDIRPEHKAFQLPKQLTSFENITAITNAYVNEDKRLQAMADAIINNQEMTNSLVSLLVDLTIIRQYIVDKEFTMSSKFKDKRPMNADITDERVKYLLNLLSQTPIFTDIIE